MKLNKKELRNLIPSKYIERNIHAELYKHIAYRNEVTILYGPRQVGKSSEILKIAFELYEKEKNSDFFYYNLDYSSKDLKNPEYFINLINSNKTTNDSKCYIFIDEAQRYEDIGLFTKYIYDRKLNFKIILTGSASLDIKEKVRETLTGRKKEFFLNSLSLSEILKLKGIDPLKVSGYFEELGLILDEYLVYGGYPEILLENSIERKKEKLEEIADSYILRDMANLFGIDNNDLLSTVSIFMAENIGNLYSTHGTSMLLSYSRDEIQRVVKALQKTFILNLIPTYSSKKTKELLHSKKIYLNDPGIRNALIGKLDEKVLLNDRGALFENAVVSHFIVKNDLKRVKFWRKQNQTEVDIVIQHSIDELEAYEVKYMYNKDNLPKSMASFLNLYGDFVKKRDMISKKNYWKYIL